MPDDGTAHSHLFVCYVYMYPVIGGDYSAKLIEALGAMREKARRKGPKVAARV